MLPSLLAAAALSSPSFSVANDRFVINGTMPISLRAGSIHYSRVHPELWEDRLMRLSALGLNAITTYVPWNFHESRPGTFDFTSASHDLVHFLRLAQKHNLYVLLRAGPYICGEWEFGGLPAWLLSNGTLALRTYAQPYISHVDSYWKRMFGLVQPLLFARSGPVIMVQVENEFGSYGDVSTSTADLAYMEHLVGTARAALGPTTLLYTTDGGDAAYMRRGSLPGGGILTIGDGCSNPAATWAAQRELNPPGRSPFLCGELYPGWLTHWGEEMANRSSSGAASALDGTLSIGNGTGSANLYMAHGGTSFGWWSGANGNGGASYQPDITSYDYDAPLSESGEHGFGSDRVDKYSALQAVLAKHQPRGTPPPPPELPLRPRAAFGRVWLREASDLLSSAAAMAPSAAERDAPEPPAGVEAIGCVDGGLVHVEAFLPHGVPRRRLLTLPQLQDRALLYAATSSWPLLSSSPPIYLGTLYRAEMATESIGGRTSIPIPPLPAGSRLLILIEAMGRINFSRAGMADARVGMLGGALLDGTEPLQARWTTRCLQLDSTQMQQLPWSPLSERREGSVFYRGHFSAPAAGVDTYLALPGFEKGSAWLNGFHLGRYWNTLGPQRALYVPGPLVRQGRNEIVVLELHNASSSATVELGDRPVWSADRTTASHRPPASAAPTNAPASFPPTGTSWQRVSGAGGEGAVLIASAPWEGVTEGHPCVVEPQVLWIASERHYRMYYRGGWSVGAIGVAISNDGLAWSKRADPVLTLNSSRSGAMQPWVVVPSELGSYREWRLFTSAWDLVSKSSRTHIASSHDGKAWVLEPLAHVPLPAKSEGRATLFGNRVVWRERHDASGVSWWMLQEVGIPDPWAIYLYTSADGLKWTSANGGAPLRDLQRHAGGAYGGPSIANVDGIPSAKSPADGRYHVWYHAASAAGNLPTDIYHASADALEGPWSVHPAGPVLEHRGSGFEYDQVADPSPVLLTGSQHAMLFYDGDNNVNASCSIGAAIAQS